MQCTVGTAIHFVVAMMHSWWALCHPQICKAVVLVTRWFKYDRDYLCVNKLQFVPVIFEPPCTKTLYLLSETATIGGVVAVSLVNVTVLRTLKMKLTLMSLQLFQLHCSWLENVKKTKPSFSSWTSWVSNRLHITKDIYRLDGPWIGSRWGQDLPQPSKPATGPTQPPM